MVLKKEPLSSPSICPLCIPKQPPRPAENYVDLVEIQKELQKKKILEQLPSIDTLTNTKNKDGRWKKITNQITTVIDSCSKEVTALQKVIAKLTSKKKNPNQVIMDTDTQ